MKDLLTSAGLLERLDISVNSAPVVVATFMSDERDEIYELSGEFQKLRSKPDFILEFSVSALDNPFKILGSNRCHVIIKNDGYNLSIDFELSFLEITGGSILQVQVGAEEPYEIKTI